MLDKIVENLIAFWLDRVCGGWRYSVGGVLVAASALIVAFTRMVPAADAQYLLAAAAIVAGVGGLMAKGDPNAPKPGGAKLGALVLAALLMGWPVGARAQEAAKAPAAPDLANLYAAGMSYSVNASPSLAGTALYAHLASDSGTYVFTAVDAVPNTLRPFTVTSNVGAGVAQKICTVGKFSVFVPTAAGISWTGKNTGWQWSSGALISIHLKGDYYLLPSVRFLKSSVSGGTGYQPIVGLLFGWGQ